MSITSLTQLPINEDGFDDVLKLVTQSADQTRSSPGCTSFSILTNAELRTEIYFLEVWEDQESQQAYIEQRMSDGSMDKLAQFFTGPPTTSILNLDS